MTDKPTIESVPADVQDAVKANLAAINKDRASGLRTFKREGAISDLYVSDIFPFPADFSVANLAPTSYLAQPEGEITGSIDTQKFSLIEERLKGLLFDQPARSIERGSALRVVKILKPDGTLGQVGFEGQINNAAAGGTEDAIGLHKQARKGGYLFYNFETGQPIYCFARNCWAAAMISLLEKIYPQHRNVIDSGYCSADHFRFVEPSRARRFFQEGGGGLFEANATTSQSRRG